MTCLGSFLLKCVLVDLVSSAFASIESTYTVTLSVSYSEKSASLPPESAVASRNFFLSLGICFCWVDCLLEGLAFALVWHCSAKWPFFLHLLHSFP